MYNIFSRLNTGGTQLKPHEVRSALNHGAFNELLMERNKNEDWRAIFGNPNKNMRDCELILRFFALLHRDYSEPMLAFLNNFMRDNRRLQKQTAEILTRDFENTIHIVCESIGNRAFRLPSSRALNAAIFDAVMVGIAKRLRHGAINDVATVKVIYDELLADPRFLDTVTASTTDKTNVITRLQLATERFHAVP